VAIACLLNLACVCFSLVFGDLNILDFILERMVDLSALRRRGFFFILDDKEANNQGFELMSDKFVKALRAATQVPDEKSGRTRCLG